MVFDPTTGQIIDVWAWLTGNGDYTTKFKKLYMNGKQYFFVGVNSQTDYIYWGFPHGGLFKVNETYGYEDGFFLGTPWNNELDGIELDLYGNYYLGWQRWWQHPNSTVPAAWMWGDTEWGGWGGWEYNVIWGKVAPVS